MGESFVIGTRGSKLALWQAQAVQQALAVAQPQLETVIRVVRTTGDVVTDVPLESLGDKGFFTKELEAALLAGEVDVCVHSMKDMPAPLPQGCTLVAMLPRADARDVLVCGSRLQGVDTLEQMPVGARLGTGSLRRSAQLRAVNPGINALPMRGNVDTRLRKAQGDEYDGAVLAAAGIKRLGREDVVDAYLPISQMVPAAGQGAVGIEAREGDTRVAQLCRDINDDETFSCVKAERDVLCQLQGGCQVPIGVHARFENGALLFDAVVLSLDGRRVARVAERFTKHTPLDQAVSAVVAKLKRQGAQDILHDVRNASEEQ